MRFRASSAGSGRKRHQIGADDVNFLTTSAFDLPDRLAAKADPALIADDEEHFVAIAESLEQSIADLSDRIDAERKAPGGIGQAAIDRDMEIHRLAARLRLLRRFGLDLCLGRMVSADFRTGSWPLGSGDFKAQLTSGQQRQGRRWGRYSGHRADLLLDRLLRPAPG